MIYFLLILLALSVYANWRQTVSLQVTRHCYERLRIWTEFELSNSLDTWRDVLAGIIDDDSKVDDCMPIDQLNWLDRMNSKLDADRNYMVQRGVAIPDAETNGRFKYKSRL